ncbi:MAG: hypothetical protein ACK5ZO_04775 [Gemmatimonas sp.]|uniref:hypothetical protein n=1 Tax=Gemmatimonas sp. TaxID=1962908 RepID=UPI0022C0039D|nr:hypothetical protein [Gemmatimonas sp.]MCZ8011167.1 hypothetical protein [Gemmatimonas sp.]MCZ8266012.1 hypothetical protein [Gemmatimonas sp.]
MVLGAAHWVAYAHAMRLREELLAQSEPSQLKAPLYPHFLLNALNAASADGTLCFANGPFFPQPGKHFDICRAERCSAGFSPREALDGAVNSTPSPPTLPFSTRGTSIPRFRWTGARWSSPLSVRVATVRGTYT